MKNIFLSFLLFIAVSCAVSKRAARADAKLRILKVDSTSSLYVFSCKNSRDSDIIIIAEKEKFINCKPFKKFILLDSVKQTMQIKDGSRYDNIGFNG